MSESPAMTAPLQVRYQNTVEDWKALQKSLPPGKRFMHRWGTVLILTGFVFLCCLPATGVLLAFGQLTAVLAGWGLAAIFLVIMVFAAARSSRTPNEETLRPATLELHPEFLEVYGERGWERRDWALIARLQQTDELFIIHRDDGLVYAIPRRAFSSPAEEKVFVETAERLHEQAQGAADLAHPAPWQDKAPAAVFAADTLQVTYSTAAPELAELQRGMILHAVDEAPQAKPKSAGAVPWVLFGIVMAMALLILARAEARDSGIGVLMGVLFFPVTALLMVWPTLGLVRAFVKRKQKPARDTSQTLTISPAGISLWSPRLESRSTWVAIDALQENEKVIVFAAHRPATVHLYVVPKSAFPDEFEARHFAETAARYRRAVHEAATEQTLTETPRVVSDNPYQPPLAK
jgi:hypothetical protein